MSQNPLVSVVIPTFNRASFVTQAVQSALAQQYPAVEIIVVDDGSTDDTCKALQPYSTQIRYLYQDNQGEAAARNTGIAASRGDLIAFLDSDDIWLPGKLETQVQFLCSHSEIGMVACHAMQIDENGNPVGDQPMYACQMEGPVSIETIFISSPLPVDALLVRRECLPSPLPFTPGVRFGADWEMCLRIAARFPIWFLAQTLTAVRVHNGNISAPFANQQQVRSKLDSRLGVIRRVYPLFARCNADMRKVRSRSEAIEYAYAAVPSYVNKAFQDAVEYLGRALQLDSATWQGGDRLADLVCHYANLILQRQGDEFALAFLRDLFRNLPEQLEQPQLLRRRIYGQIHIARAFRHYRGHQYSRVFPDVMQGILNDSAFIGNRGVASILARSFVSALRGRKQTTL